MEKLVVNFLEWLHIEILILSLKRNVKIRLLRSVVNIYGSCLYLKGRNLMNVYISVEQDFKSLLQAIQDWRYMNISDTGAYPVHLLPSSSP